MALLIALGVALIPNIAMEPLLQLFTGHLYDIYRYLYAIKPIDIYMMMPLYINRG